MRIWARFTVFLFGLILSTFFLAGSGWSKNFGMILSEHASYKGKCLEADDTGDWIIRLSTCDDTKAEQWWFVTRAYPSDGTFKTQETIRSVMWPNRCMTDVDLNLDQGRVLTLRPCFEGGLTEHQFWEPKNFRKRIGMAGKCISVSEHKGFVRGCDWGKDRQEFDLTDVGKVTNFDLGRFITDHPNVDLPDAHRFHDYADCAAQNQNETSCFINLGDEGKYGYRLGTEVTDSFRDDLPDLIAKIIDAGYSGSQRGEGLLDLGDRFSADRCAQAHDRWYWAQANAVQIPDPTRIISPGTANAALQEWWQNWVGMLQCIRTVRPTTVQENNAIEVAEAAIKLITSTLETGFPNTRIGTCLPDEPLGLMPPAEAPVLPCECRLEINAPDPDQERIEAACHEDYLAELEGAVQMDGPIAAWLPEVAGEAYIAFLVERAQSAPEPTTHLFARGDWVWRLGMAAGTKDIHDYIAAFETLNPGVDADRVYVGRSYLMPLP